MKRSSDSTHVYSGFLVRLLVAACVILAGCAGPALLKDRHAIVSSQPLAEGKDERILALIDTVILRNGDGAWASDAEWDEYLIRMRALSDEPVVVREIVIFDALDHRIETRTDRGALVDGTREIERRYQQSGQLVRALGGNSWAVAGTGVAGGAVIVGVSAPAGFAGMATVAGAAVVVTGVGLVFGGAGVMRLVNNAQVDSEIKRRRTTLPVALPRGAEASVDLFFPLTPLSGRAQVTYTDRHGEHRLDIDTRQALVNLELEQNPPPTIVARHDPKFPDHARRAGIDRGHVIAHLTLDSQGHVQRVDVIESVPSGVFTNEARLTFQGWTYTKSRHNSRTVEARLEFKR